MNRKLVLAAVAACAFSAPASAQVMIDMSEITCKDLAGYDQDTRDFIGSWMSGYFSASKNFNELDLKYLKRNKEKVVAYCKKHQKDTLFNVVKKVAK